MKPGDRVTVLIDGVPHETIIDENGTQRFPTNRVIRYLIDSHPHVDLNALWHMMDSGMISRDELMQFYLQIGYSVTGFEELFANSEIENPIWENKDD